MIILNIYSSTPSECLVAYLYGMFLRLIVSQQQEEVVTSIHTMQHQLRVVLKQNLQFLAGGDEIARGFAQDIILSMSFY